jgi:hypothetical protein
MVTLMPLCCAYINSPTPLQILPPELIYNIGTFCTPSSLASLAQVHTSYQREAERALYRTLSIRICPNDVKCLDTLFAHPQRASIVRSLTAEFPRWESEENSVATESLFGALGHMHALSDLRIRLRVTNHVSLKEQINDALRSVWLTHHRLWQRTDDTAHRSKHFRLHTLYCNSFLHISEIIDAQPEIQLLGIYNSGEMETLETLKHLAARDSLSTLPTVFVLERETFLPIFNHLTIFPAFYPTRPIMCRNIADSFDRDVARDILTDKASVSQVCIYLRDFSDMSLIRHIVEDMVRCFPLVSWLNLWVERPSQVVSLMNLLCLECQLISNMRNSNIQNSQRSWLLLLS